MHCFSSCDTALFYSGKADGLSVNRIDAYCIRMANSLVLKIGFKLNKTARLLHGVEGGFLFIIQCEDGEILIGELIIESEPLVKNLTLAIDSKMSLFEQIKAVVDKAAARVPASGK